MEQRKKSKGDLKIYQKIFLKTEILYSLSKDTEIDILNHLSKDMNNCV